MKKLLEGVKLALLLAVLLIVGLSAIPRSATADFQTQSTCEGAGHSCHATIGGTLYHLKELPAY